MNKRILSLLLVLTLMFSLSISASAAMTYVPDNIVYQNIDGKQLAIKTYTLLPDQDPSDLAEPDFEFDGFRYRYSSIVKEELNYSEQHQHKEQITITTSSKNLEDILANLEPTIEYDDGTASGTLALDHSTLKTEAAGYTDSYYTVSATKNYSGLDRNDSSYIDRTVVKDGRTLSLNNVSWAVESTMLVGDDLMPATYCAVATYTGTAHTTKATGYITTAEYVGTVTASGISSIRYTVTFIGTPIQPLPPIEPEKPEVPARSMGAASVMPILGVLILLGAIGALLFLALTRKNITVYEATGKNNEYTKCGKLHLDARNPELRIDRLANAPQGKIAVEIDAMTAKRLFGKTISIIYYERRYSHTVGTVNGAYWFKLDIGDAPAEAHVPQSSSGVKGIASFCLALCMLLTLAGSAYAADYDFDPPDITDYYNSTNYEDQYDAAYNYGGKNHVDYDIPEIQYGLAQEFLETSLSNPYLQPGTQYGIGPTPAADDGYPDVSYGAGEQTIEVTYKPAVTAAQLMQQDSSLGTVAIDRVGLKAKVFEDTTSAAMAKGAGHFIGSGYWTGNVALFGHNRGNGCAYFAQLKNVRVGDTVTYTTCLGTKTYRVETVNTISYTDYSPLNEMGDNRITLITCIADQPTLRLCVQAEEFK